MRELETLFSEGVSTMIFTVELLLIMDISVTILEPLLIILYYQQ
jgi:hypothetical protein